MPNSADPSPVWTDERLAALARSAGRSLFPKPSAGHPPVDLAPPVIPGYEVIRQIGSGGMGSVWLARSGDESRDVAVKVLHPGWAADADAASRFEMEVDALASLTHPNIVGLLDAGETADHQLFLATEYVDGCDLSHLLRGGTIPPERAIGIFRKVAAAISHAHQSGIIHRDLKPANILVGAGDLVKVTDFGMAKHFSNSATQPTDAFGSPYYLAPELTRSASAATPASDVYSLAVLLYELLSGKLPLGSYTPLSALGHHKRLDRVIRNALRDDPAVRKASVKALLDEIDRSWNAAASRAKWRKRAPWIVSACFIILGPLAGHLWNESRRKPVRQYFPLATQAARDKPWVNSLGIKFIPVEGTEVLFSVYETRNSEWLLFRDVEQTMLPAWRRSQSASSPLNRPVMGLQGMGKSDPDLAGKPDHPAQGISWQDTQYFCNWLTLRERNEGRLTHSQYYRLPTDKEWDMAAGMNEATAHAADGNFAGPEARTARWPESFPTCEQRDPFPESAPVGSFPAAASGLFDLAGNALEWVDEGHPPADPEEAASPRMPHLLLGGSWATPSAENSLTRDHRFRARANKRRIDYGFRCVLVIREESGKAADEKKRNPSETMPPKP